MNRELRKVRCEDAISVLNRESSAVFFTLTTPDEVDFMEIRSRWRRFRNSLMRYLRREGRKPQYVMNYELHPGYLIKVVRDSNTVERVLHGSGKSHGWHIHGVISCFLPYERIKLLVNKAGFGRIDLSRVTSIGIADYLVKHALKAYRGLTRREREAYGDMRLRLVNASRGLPSLDSYEYRSDLILRTRRIMAHIRATHEDKAHGVRYSDYRRVHLVSEVCALLGFTCEWQLLELVEFLGRKIPVLEAVARVSDMGRLLLTDSCNSVSRNC